jgi:prepilin-type N-terminal cleavage/methylation domain-containing protein
MRRKRAFTLVELLLVIAIFMITFAALTPIVNKMQERAHMIKCMNNARSISLALHMYAADHGEAFPKALGALYPDYIKNEKIFDCPASAVRGTKESPGYEYVAGLTESSDGSAVVLYDKEGNHSRFGRNVVRVSGLVELEQSGSGKPK